MSGHETKSCKGNQHDQNSIKKKDNTGGKEGYIRADEPETSDQRKRVQKKKKIDYPKTATRCQVWEKKNKEPQHIGKFKNRFNVLNLVEDSNEATWESNLDQPQLLIPQINPDRSNLLLTLTLSSHPPTNRHTPKKKNPAPLATPHLSKTMENWPPTEPISYQLSSKPDNNKNLPYTSVSLTFKPNLNTLSQPLELLMHPTIC